MSNWLINHTNHAVIWFKIIKNHAFGYIVDIATILFMLKNELRICKNFIHLEYTVCFLNTQSISIIFLYNHNCLKLFFNCSNM